MKVSCTVEQSCTSVRCFLSIFLRLIFTSRWVERRNRWRCWCLRISGRRCGCLSSSRMCCSWTTTSYFKLMEGVGLLNRSWSRYSFSAFITVFITSAFTLSCKWRGRRLVLSHALANKKSSSPACFLSLVLSLRNVRILSTPSLSPFWNLLKSFLHFLLALSV